MVIPRGLFFPPVTVAERIIGKSGQIQGANMVTKPDRKAKRKRISIGLTPAGEKIINDGKNYYQNDNARKIANDNQSQK